MGALSPRCCPVPWGLWNTSCQQQVRGTARCSALVSNGTSWASKEPSPQPTEVENGLSGKRRKGPWFSFQLFWTSSGKTPKCQAYGHPEWEMNAGIWQT